MINILNNLFSVFKINAKAINVRQGLRIDQYQIKLGIGERVDRIKSIQNEIALALRSYGSPNIYPIYKEGIVAVDISKSLVKPVSFLELAESDEYKRDFEIPLLLGRDMWGNPIIKDLTDCPHVLIGGTTGAGKSVLLKSIVSGILHRKPSTKDVNFLFIDPKGTELAEFDKSPHKCVRRLVNGEDILGGLKAINEIMETRYKKYFKNARVNSIKEYRKKKKMPYIVIVIDELADIFLADKRLSKQTEDILIKIAQKGRAAGIHLVANTQRPSADLVSKSIQANLATRIALKTASKTDSRIILGESGAENLTGNGDMLLSFNGNIDFVRIQGALIDKETVTATTKGTSKVISMLEYLREKVA